MAVNVFCLRATHASCARSLAATIAAEPSRLLLTLAKLAASLRLVFVRPSERRPSAFVGDVNASVRTANNRDLRKRGLLPAPSAAVAKQDE